VTHSKEKLLHTPGPWHVGAEIGYSFAYFTWMRFARPDSYRAKYAARGMTFFLTFEAIQNGAFGNGEH